MNIKLIQLINSEYIICDLEELDEEPSVYMKNPYRVIELSYWEHNEDDTHDPQQPCVFLNKSTETVSHNGKECISTQYDYAQLQQYPLFTNDRDVLLNSDRLMTVVEPSPDIIKLYMELVSK